VCGVGGAAPCRHVLPRFRWYHSYGRSSAERPSDDRPTTARRAVQPRPVRGRPPDAPFSAAGQGSTARRAVQPRPVRGRPPRFEPLAVTTALLAVTRAPSAATREPWPPRRRRWPSRGAVSGTRTRREPPSLAPPSIRVPPALGWRNQTPRRAAGPPGRRGPRSSAGPRRSAQARQRRTPPGAGRPGSGWCCLRSWPKARRAWPRANRAPPRPAAVRGGLSVEHREHLLEVVEIGLGLDQ